jgi:hypothetical protein
MRAKGDGFFSKANTQPYQPWGAVIGQIHEDSCVAACCRMWLKDQGVEEPEVVVRAVLEVRGLGTNISRVPAAMRQFGSTAQYEFRDDLTLADLQQALLRGSAMVFLKESPQARDGHTLLVEAIADEQWVAMRDPWPPGYGAAYKVRLDVFLRAWLLPNAALNRDAGRAVVVK